MTAVDAPPGPLAPHTSPATAATGGSTTRRAGRLSSPSSRRSAVDYLVLVVLLGAGVQAFGPVFGAAVGYVAAGSGVVAGLALAVIAAHREWSRLATLLAGMIVFLLLGGPVAVPDTTIGGVVPTLDTFQDLTLLTFRGWRDLLTVSLPAGAFDGPATVPLLTALVTATTAGTLVLHARRAQWALIPCLSLLVVGILWGTHRAPAALAQGAIFAVTALAWSAWRSQISNADGQARFVHTGPVAANPLRYAGPAVAVLASAVVLTTGLVTVADSGNDRHVLRDDINPPLDLRDYASPLTQYRYLELDQKNKTLFNVSGLPDGARIRLAALDQYDGNVFNVTEGSARFGRVGSTILPSQFSDQDAPVHRIGIEIGDYTGVWLPGGGDLRGIDFTDSGSDRERAGLYFNPATGNALTTGGVGTGTTYTIDLVLPRTSADQVADLPDTSAPGQFAFAPDTATVDSVPALAADDIGDADTPMAQLRAMADELSRGGYANGADDRPSFAGHTVRRLDLMINSATGQLVGDDEQYSTLMTLMARSLGLPSRVVMGFYPDPEAPASDPVAITGDDAHVWVEVLFDDLGWVPFDPTPADENPPDESRPKPQERNDPQVLPPPEVPEKRVKRPPAKAESDTTERETDDKQDSDGGHGLVPTFVLVGGGGLGLLLLPFGLILALKARRRRRRLQAPRLVDRISGGWAELVDTATDIGTPVPAHATRWESAELMTGAHPALDLQRMADRVDAHVFGIGEPTDADVADVWTDIDAARRQLRSSVTRRRRVRSRFSVRSLARPKYKRTWVRWGRVQEVTA